MARNDEIDGLRTIAVFAVILSHAGVPFFTGGFLGVDIFFVISGFLITRLIVDELEDGSFSLFKFYDRRVRRIFPALFLVCFVSLGAGWWLMSADALKNLGESLVATTFFSNNILLNITSGYWESESSFKPLLHTWSLGVEEQYYAIIPIILMVVFYYRKNLIGLFLLFIGIVSFLLSCLLSTDFAAFNFYELPTRAWELSVGGLAALSYRRSPLRSSDILATLGLGLIIGAVVLVPADSPSPGVMSVAPVIGTALVLLFCRAGWVHRLLSSRSMVGLGLISYSLYLWHQPLFAYLRISHIERPALWEYLAATAATMILAALTWRFVEQPFRNRALMSTRLVALILGPAAIMLAGIGLLLVALGGVPHRFDVAPGAEAAGTYKAYNMRVFAFKRDVFLPKSTLRLLVLGNSQGRDFINMARENGQFGGYDIVYRDDFDLCDPPQKPQWALARQATEIVVVIDGPLATGCSARQYAARSDLAGKVIFVGPKDFGININPYARLPLNERLHARVAVSDDLLAKERYFRAMFPAGISVDVMQHLSADGRTVPIFDRAGRILSEDRRHVTRSGAKFVGALIFQDPAWAAVQRSSVRRQRGGH